VILAGFVNVDRPLGLLNFVDVRPAGALKFMDVTGCKHSYGCVRMDMNIAATIRDAKQPRYPRSKRRCAAGHDKTGSADIPTRQKKNPQQPRYPRSE